MLGRSLSSMSPKASHGHTTVISVPRPSMPGMSSPNLKRNVAELAQKKMEPSWHMKQSHSI
ncbi:hypothetical protein EYF80_006069 [Liparis tanakae]|uniref:Uncharacterized protein n=1 Tax=Liparis tanakae TaxID=230148 RepID=A0A4Z2J0S5_9TELE|nr:hypothetical protein EYF80_006069 [Liparis tanakae]